MSRSRYFAVAVAATILVAPVHAREEVIAGDGRFQGVESAKTEMDNWPQVKELILSSYGLTDVPMMDVDDVKKVGDPANPDALQVELNNVNMILIVNKPAPPGLFPMLPRLFPDLTDEDVQTFTDGMIVSAITLPGQPARVDITLLRKSNDVAAVAPPSALTGSRYEETFGMVFPDDTIKMNSTSVDNMEMITLIVPGGVEEVAGSLVAQFERDGVEHIVRANPENGSIGAENDKGTASITLLAVDGEPDTVLQMRIQKKD